MLKRMCRCVCRSQNVCLSIVADSESCEQCGDFGTWVGRWSTWNGDTTNFTPATKILHKHCLHVHIFLHLCIKFIFLVQLLSDLFNKYYNNMKAIQDLNKFYDMHQFIWHICTICRVCQQVAQYYQAGIQQKLNWVVGSPSDNKPSWS